MQEEEQLRRASSYREVHPETQRQQMDVGLHALHGGSTYSGEPSMRVSMPGILTALLPLSHYLAVVSQSLSHSIVH